MTPFRPPRRSRIRRVTHVQEGHDVLPCYDAVVANPIVRDERRPPGLARAAPALTEPGVEVSETRPELVLEIAVSEHFEAGGHATAYVDEPVGRLAARGMR